MGTVRRKAVNRWRWDEVARRTQKTPLLIYKEKSPAPGRGAGPESLGQ